jgi:putative ATP-binding cassette transporter
MKAYKKIIIANSCIISLCVILFFVYLFLSDIQFKNKAQLIRPNDKQISVDLDVDMQKAILEIEKMIYSVMNEAKIPGMSVAIVKDDSTIYQSGFGYSDLASGKPATASTLYEIGSNSKAFTALGVLQLQRDGLININDAISEYIPWLKFYYDNNEVDIRIEEFLYHTSGISSGTIASIPEYGESRDAIKNTVEAFNPFELVNQPGEKYEYATINYDVLGLLIEMVSGMSYEDYIQAYVLNPMSLKNTYLYRSKLDQKEMAFGYKLGFLMPKYYKAPIYEGNKPAGYIISNANDMAEWLKIQMGTSSTSSFENDIVTASHIPNRKVKAFGDGMSYAAGWIVYDNDGIELCHSGSNPNFSSFILFRPEDKIGVAVLCNIKTYYTADIANSILALLTKHPYDPIENLNFDQKMDKVSIVIFLIAMITTYISIYKIASSLYQLVKSPGKIHLKKSKPLRFLVHTIIFLLGNCCLYLIPDIVLNHTTWSYIFTWYPFSIELALFSIVLSIWMRYISVCIKRVDKK